MKILPTTYRPSLRRACVFLLGAWYVAFSSGSLFPFLDWAIPLAKSVAHPNFPCAQHACGCQTRDECRSRCCCSSANLAQAHHLHGAPLKTRVSFLLDSRCKGHFPGHGPENSPKVPPHILEISWVVPPAPALDLFFREELLAPDSACPLPPEKVPI